MKNQCKDAEIILIGKKLEVTDSGNKTFIGLHGEVIDETKNTLTIRTEKGDKKILKENTKFMIENKKINGTKLLGRIEVRIKNNKRMSA